MCNAVLNPDLCLSRATIKIVPLRAIAIRKYARQMISRKLIKGLVVRMKIRRIVQSPIRKHTGVLEVA
jgi:hypothetical protein